MVTTDVTASSILGLQAGINPGLGTYVRGVDADAVGFMQADMIPVGRYSGAAITAAAGVVTVPIDSIFVVQILNHAVKVRLSAAVTVAASTNDLLWLLLQQDGKNVKILLETGATVPTNGLKLATLTGNPVATVTEETNLDQASATQLGHTIWSSGLPHTCVVDFNATGTAASNITIGGVIYLEADAADAPNGVWTNGANAGASAVSLTAAINGDTRAAGVALDIQAVISDAGDSSVVSGKNTNGIATAHVVTSSAGAATVDSPFKGGRSAGYRRTITTNYVVTAQDVLADECNIVLPFTPTGFVMSVRSATGLELATPLTALATIQASPARIRLNFAGATDPAAGVILHTTAFE
jgi:hypothetical protein